MVFVPFFLAPPVAALEQPQEHGSEIKLFGSTMAVARTVPEACPDMEANAQYLEDLRRRLHVVEADHSAFAVEARLVASVLRRGLAKAVSRKEWCDAAYRLYGPEGTMIPKLMSRAKP